MSTKVSSLSFENIAHEVPTLKAELTIFCDDLSSALGQCLQNTEDDSRFERIKVVQSYKMEVQHLLNKVQRHQIFSSYARQYNETKDVDIFPDFQDKKDALSLLRSLSQYV